MTNAGVDCVLYRVTLPLESEPGWLKEDSIVTVLGGVIISLVGLGFSDDGVTFQLEYDVDYSDAPTDFTQGGEWEKAAIALKHAGYDIERVDGYVLPITILDI